MNEMNAIEESCRQLAKDRATLRKKYEARQKDMSVVAAAHDKEIRFIQDVCVCRRLVLVQTLERCREEFRKPKSREFHGITVGFEKERDSVTLPEDTILIDRIEKLLPAKQAETVLDRSVKLIKAAFKKLPREILQKLGCNIVSGADKAVVRANDDDIETLVHKSLGEAAPAPEVAS